MFCVRWFDHFGQNVLRAFDRPYFELFTEGSDAEQKISI